MEFNFNDIFNTNFLKKVSGFSFTDAALAITAAFLVGMFIYLIYKKTFGGVMYSRAFNISLVLLTMLTTLVILAITSNVIIALGMVGALSIVRFRTPIKDPMDLVFLFWSIVAGIVIGAGLIPLAALGSVIIGIILIAFVSRNVIETPYIVIINCADENAEGSAVNLMKKVFSKYRVKSKTVTAGKGIELVYEIRLKNGETKFINELSAIPGITNSALVSFNGEYAS
ncbi:hypothetical protein SPSYN_01285 [Sporotomaculum syntrophicum]|uniref:DUF4956 domain-containing protein n=1 Tax=Sporotomaculum syntrophicum TaxID=182264 RepID=A0A9D2WPP3_9FIRM|nr:DUF4956 domain-containing protein [Sporotomaculum syntrophicum]KAF1085149.1 hypothetical protein SPSYN_01285 [Sporotomaculum syntrophicum]